MPKELKPAKKQSRAADQQQIHHLQKQLAAALRENKRQEAEIAELKRKIEEQNATIAALAGSESNLKAEKVRLESELQILTTDFSALEIERDRLRGSIITLEEGIESKNAVIAEQDNTINNLTEEAVDLETGKNDAINHADDLSRAIAILERRLGGEQETTTSLRKDLEVAQARSTHHRDAAATIAHAYLVLASENINDCRRVYPDEILDDMKKAGSPEDVTDTALAITVIAMASYEKKNQSQATPADSNNTNKDTDISA